MAKTKFTVKEQRFIDFYDGNATDAARKAGYKNPKRSGIQNVSKRSVWDQIKKRENKRNGNHIASREERQKFWTNVLLGKIVDPAVIGYDDDGSATVIDIPPKMTDRLKASELLGRSEADFTDKHLHDLGKETAKHVYGHLDKVNKGK